MTDVNEDAFVITEQQWHDKNLISPAYDAGMLAWNDVQAAHVLRSYFSGYMVGPVAIKDNTTYAAISLKVPGTRTGFRQLIKRIEQLAKKSPILLYKLEWRTMVPTFVKYDENNEIVNLSEPIIQKPCWIVRIGIPQT